MLKRFKQHDNLEVFHLRGYLEGPIFCLDENMEIKTVSLKRKGGVKDRKITDYKLKNLPDVFYTVSYDFKNKRKVFKKATKRFVGQQDCYEIELENGKKVIATSEHKFFNENEEEIKVKDLKIGDEILHIKSMDLTNRIKHREKLVGDKNPFYNKKHSIVSVEKIKSSLETYYTYNSGINLNKPFSIETRKKMSETKLRLFKEGKIKTWCKGLTKENNGSLRKISENMIGEKHFDCSLEKNSQWLGGKSFEPYGIEFNEELRNKIRKRDFNKCRLCGNNKRLAIHHINYDKKNNTSENLITLCLLCHGKTTINREFWSNYLKQLNLLQCIPLE